MSENTALTSFLEALESEKIALDSANIDVMVEDRIAAMRAKIRAEVEADIVERRKVIDIRIDTINQLVQVISLVATPEVDESEVSEGISDETF